MYLTRDQSLKLEMAMLFGYITNPQGAGLIVINGLG